MVDQRVIDFEAIQKISEETNSEHFETSAKDNINVESVFYTYNYKTFKDIL